MAVRKKLPVLRHLFNRRAWQGISIGTGIMLTQAVVGPPLLLDSGEDHMRARGWNPELLQQVSDKPVYVHNGNLGSQIFTYTGWFATRNHEHSSARFHTPLDDFLNRCFVKISPTTPHQHIEHDLLTTDYLLDAAPVDDDLYTDYVMFHEYRHCHDDNAKLTGNRKEADADIGALRAMLAGGADPEILRAVLYARTFNLFNYTHNTALYIDAAFNGAPLPDDDAVNEATHIITRKVANGVVAFCREQAQMDLPAVRVSRIDVRQVASILRAARDDDDVTPLARRRIDLFLEAVDYFGPTAMAAWRKQEGNKPYFTRCGALYP